MQTPQNQARIVSFALVPLLFTVMSTTVGLAQTENQSDGGNITIEPTPETTNQDAGGSISNQDAGGSIIINSEGTTIEQIPTEFENQSDGGNQSDAQPTFEPSSEEPTFSGQDIDENSIDVISTRDYNDSFGPFYGEPATTGEISEELAELGAATGTNPGLVYIFKQNSGLRLILVTSEQNEDSTSPQTSTKTPLLLASQSQTSPNLSSQSQNSQAPIAQVENTLSEDFSGTVISKFVPNVKSKQLDKTVKGLVRRVSDPSNLDSTSYLDYSQQLYDWMLRPLQEDISDKGIDTLIFVMDRGFRAFPISVLHDGESFVVENYNVSLIPSFNLTDTRYKPVDGTQMLGLGISESVQGLSPLPSVALEMPTLTEEIWQGQFFLNEGATLEQLKQLTRQKQYDIVHLATHAEFKPGNLSKSFIQLWDQRVSFFDLRTVARESQWSENPTIELLVLSACQTAIGNRDAELGFSGLALQTGAKSALGSLWYVSDEGTLALMSEFYSALDSAPIKSAALRNAQLAMLNSETQIRDNKIQLSNGLEIDLPAELQGITRDRLQHPYYWSAFTLVGNWN